MIRNNLNWFTLLVLGLLVALPLMAQEATEQPQVMPAGLAAHLEANAVITETLLFSDGYLDRLQLPKGFSVQVFAKGLGNTRMLLVTPDGTIFVTRRDEGDVIALTDADGDGVADSPDVNVVLSDLPLVHGITFHEGNVYLATEKQVLVSTWNGGASLGTPQPIVSDLPGGGQHPNRTLAFGPDGKLYVSIGSTCNACVEPDPESAALLWMQIDGSEREVFASGLRNTIGWGWHPVTGEMWGMDHGSDWRGDDQPPEELNRLEYEGNYGWPFCFGNQQPDLYIPVPPPGGSGRAVYCEKTLAPELEYTAHSAPIAMIFYTGTQLDFAPSSSITQGRNKRVK